MNAGVARLVPLSPPAVAMRLRRTAGRFATGVTVVTTADGERVHGMTANGFLSVSLSPPLVLVSLGACRMADLLPQTGRYAISVLDASQEALAQHFAGQRTEEPVSPCFTWRRGLPFIDGALAQLGCRVVDTHPAGDHRLWIGEVEHLDEREGAPLVFFGGRFERLRQADRAVLGAD